LRIAAGARAAERRLRLNTQGSVKKEQDNRYLQDGHCGPACAVLDEMSICLSWGKALPKCGYKTSESRANRLCRGAIEEDNNSTGTGNSPR
jgi:hypothetical protein